jgi:hydroxymethylbilane synthase
MARIVIGTRRSRLALTQTNLVVERLRALHAGLEIEVREMVTTGDQIQDRPLHLVGTKGMFTKELDEALLAGAIDAAVHSLKDLPAEIPTGIALAAVPEREEPFDCLLAAAEVSLDALPAGARLGTGSTRRRAQLAARRADFEFVEVRGNLDTRWRKHEEGQCHALVLALAGVKRLGWADRVREVIAPEVCLPAPCQGTLGVTAREADAGARELLAPLTDERSRVEAAAERAFLVTLAGGCAVPAAALARLGPDGVLRMKGLVASPDGTRAVRAVGESAPGAAAGLGRDVATRLLDSGGRALLAGSVR